MRSGFRVLLVAGTLLSLLIGIGLPAQAAQTVVISQGHVDVVSAVYQSNQLRLYVHDESVTPAVDRVPSDVLLEALPQAKTAVPNDSRYSFLGNPGDPVWVLPQTQNYSLLWPGLSAESIAPGVFQGETLNFTLLNVYGPGQYSVYDTDSFGNPHILYSTGYDLPQNYVFPVGGHHHSNWTFGAAGYYVLTYQVTGTLVGGKTVSSGPVNFYFKVDA